MIVPKPEGGNFEKAPCGMQRAVCVKVIELGIHPGYEGVGFKPKLMMVFELEERMTEGDFAGKRFLVHREYTSSMHEKATFRKHLESWRGRVFDSDAIDAFCNPSGEGTDVLIGKQATLNIIESASGYPRIDAVMPAMAGEELVPELAADWMPEWIAKKIQEGFPAKTFTDGAPMPVDGDAPVF